MKAYKFPNIKKNNLNNVSTRQIVATKRMPNNFNKYTHYGEKIQETNNYILYASGNQKSYYEFYPKETQFKVSEKDTNKKLYNNKSFINYRNRNNYYRMPERNDPDKIMNSSDNYCYKETLNIKDNDPNLKVLTIHNMPENPLKIGTQTTKVINNNVRVWKREFNQYSERNQGLKVVKANKSYDNIIKRKNNYRIKINNEVTPNNHKSKIVKITKLQKGQIREIYQKKYIKKNDYINNVEPCYINSYTKKINEPIKYNINVNNNNIIKKENKNKYFINNDYESNEYGYNIQNKTFRKKNVFCEDEESKNIICPIHGNISIVIHKNHYRVNRGDNLYQ